MKAINILRTVAVLWIVSLMASPALPGVVICIGSHGHVAVEAEHDNHACGDHHSHNDSDSAHAQNDCGDCLDLTLSFDGESIRPDGSRRISVISFPQQVLQLTLQVSSRQLEHPAVTATAVPVLSLITQRSVVLRT